MGLPLRYWIEKTVYEVETRWVQLVFWEMKGTISINFLEKKWATVNSNSYCKLIR